MKLTTSPRGPKTHSPRPTRDSPAALSSSACFHTSGPMANTWRCACRLCCRGPLRQAVAVLSAHHTSHQGKQGQSPNCTTPPFYAKIAAAHGRQSRDEVRCRDMTLSTFSKTLGKAEAPMISRDPMHAFFLTKHILHGVRKRLPPLDCLPPSRRSLVNASSKCAKASTETPGSSPKTQTREPENHAIMTQHQQLCSGIHI